MRLVSSIAEQFVEFLDGIAPPEWMAQAREDIAAGRDVAPIPGDQLDEWLGR